VIAAAVLWEILQLAGGYYIGHVLKNTTDTYGVFGLVIALLIWLHLGAQMTLYAAELNVVLARRLWPRSLLGPPTAPADEDTLDRARESGRAPGQRARRSRVQTELNTPFDSASRTTLGPVTIGVTGGTHHATAPIVSGTSDRKNCETLALRLAPETAKAQKSRGYLCPPPQVARRVPARRHQASRSRPPCLRPAATGSGVRRAPRVGGR
jgi:hypothetical protein